MKLKACFLELITEPINLVNTIYQFLEINMGAEYENELKREALKAKTYKSEHKYSGSIFDIDELNSYYF